MIGIVGVEQVDLHPAIAARGEGVPEFDVGLMAGGGQVDLAGLPEDRAVELTTDQVYVIAPGRKLELTDAALGASTFDRPRGQCVVIDLFFRSLCNALVFSTPLT